MATLCQLCQKAVSTQTTEVEYHHNASPQALYDSAKAGCHLCTELWDALKHHELFRGIENAKGQDFFGFSYQIVDDELTVFHFNLFYPNRKREDEFLERTLANIIALPFDGKFALHRSCSTFMSLLFRTMMLLSFP